MENWTSDKMTPFDRSLRINSLLWIKLFIPYLPPETQRMMAIYVRFTELQYTFSSFHTFRRKSHDPQDMFQEMRPFLSPSVCESIDNLVNMMSMMEMMKEFQNEASGDGSGSGNGFTGEGGFDPMSMMAGILSPEQQSMFEMFSNLNSGGETDDGLD